MILYLLISYWWITAAVIIGIWFAIKWHDRKIDKLVSAQGVISPPEPNKRNVPTPTTIKILKLYKGRETKLNTIYIHRKLGSLEDLENSLMLLVEQCMLKVEVKYENTYYVITQSGMLHRNKNLYK